ncbi:MAG: cysteine desulfurase family protein [Aggregatilineales bacterium]
MINKNSVYLDYSATTPVDPRVVDVMMPYFSEVYGNSSSSHSFGRKAEQAIEESRETIAKILNCQPSEVVFTSGGSESDNLAIRGAAWTRRQLGQGQHIVTTPVEHSAVSKTMAQLADVMGFEHTVLPIDALGMVDPEEFTTACKSGTTIASVIYANNEVGSINPIPQLADQARAHDVWFHTDAVQAAGQLTLDVKALGVDLMSISAHKFYGPKGVGALYIRDGINLTSSQTGGSHEEGRRAGTLNTPFIVGMATALKLAYDELDTHNTHYRAMRDMLVEGIQTGLPQAQFTGHPENRLPSHASFIFEGLDSSTLLMHLDMKGIAASGGSACKTGNPEPSGVLLSMGFEPQQSLGSLRLTVGRSTTADEVNYAVDVIVETVKKLTKLKREMSL